MKEKYREIGLTVFFLLFVVGMTFDIPAMFQKDEKSSVLAATTEKPKKKAPIPTITPTPTIAWPTWTPTPIPSGAPESQPTATVITPPTTVDQPTPTPITSGPTPTPNILGQAPEHANDFSNPQFPQEPGRGGLLDTVDEITDPLDDLLPL